MAATAQILAEIAARAGAVIMRHYQAGPLAGKDVARLKADRSPVTDADEEAERLILAALADAFPSVPVVAEEEAAAGRIQRVGGRFFLVDPLDGTKEFLRRNGEFTVNIALIEGGVPVMGVVFAPATNVLYAADSGKAWKINPDGQRLELHCKEARPPLVVVSRSHSDDQELQDYLAQLGEHQTVSIGSSLKFCLVAEGSAQLYPRFGPTSVWDTAAGHAVAAAAGALVKDWTGHTLDYHPRESLINPGFRVSLF